MFYTILTCDNCGDTYRIAYCTGISHATSIARSKGFSVVKNKGEREKTYCPACAKERRKRKK